VLKRNFPNAAIKYEYTSEELRSPRHQMILRIDVYLPELKLGLEYQGEQHFADIFGEIPSEALVKDEEKLGVLEHKGITLIEIPFWWDSTDASLLQTIIRRRPDLKPLLNSEALEGGEPIPTDPPAWALAKLNLDKPSMRLTPF